MVKMVKGKSDDLAHVNVYTLQERVFELEQQFAAKDVMIHELRTNQPAQNSMIQALEVNLGYVTALLFDLKQKLLKDDKGTDGGYVREGGSGSGTGGRSGDDLNLILQEILVGLCLMIEFHRFLLELVHLLVLLLLLRGKIQANMMIQILTNILLVRDLIQHLHNPREL